MELLDRAKKQGSRFLNPVPTTTGGLSLIFKVLPLYLNNRAEREPRRSLGPFRTEARVYAAPPESGLRVTWLGHSSMLLEIDGLRVLIDPVWEQRASPVEWFGPKRFFAPPMALEELPELDAILISHDHYDHLGAGTVRRLARLKAAERAAWVTSVGVGRRLRRFGVPEGRIVELDWTQSTGIAGVTTAELGQGVRVTAWPARHFSGRTPWDRFRTLWSSFVLEGPRHRVYFGADSGWWEGFEAIAAQYERFDLTMLEIGAFHPLWAEIHLGPDGAARAYEAMGGLAKVGPLMPIHWGLFNLALHGWRQPIDQLEEVASRDGLRLWTPTPGVPTEVVEDEAVRERWWG